MKKILSLLLVLFMVITLTGCDDENKQSMINSSENNSRFVLQEAIGSDYIYVDTRTGVLYFVHQNDASTTSGYNFAWGSVLMGADGLPLLADGYARPEN